MDWSKLKASADENIKVNQKLKFALGRLENAAFLIFLQSFQKAFYKEC